MEIDKKLDFISKLRLSQPSLPNEEIAIFNEIVNDLKVLEAIKINSKMPDFTSTPEGSTLVVESTLYKAYPAILDDGGLKGISIPCNFGDFDRVLSYFMKFYKEKLNV